MSTLAEHIKRLQDRREAINPLHANDFLLWDDQQFRTDALLLCTTHLDEIAAALTREQEAQSAVRTDPTQPWTVEHLKNYPTEAVRVLNERLAAQPNDDWQDGFDGKPLAVSAGVAQLDSWYAGRMAAQPAAQEPSGWKLMPIEPTPAMLVAMWEDRDSMRGKGENAIARVAYRSLLAAAPQPPRAQEPHK